MLDPSSWASQGIGGLALLALVGLVIYFLKAQQKKDEHFTDTIKEIRADDREEREADRKERRDDREERKESAQKLADSIDKLAESLPKKGAAE